jgi:uncharacterized DUF497 family protein
LQWAQQAKKRTCGKGRAAAATAAIVHFVCTSVCLFMKFNWDDGNWFKCTARMPQEEIEGFLVRPGTRIWPDPSEKEGPFPGDRIQLRQMSMFVVFALRLVEGEIQVRPISARYAPKRKPKHGQNENEALAQV